MVNPAIPYPINYSWAPIDINSPPLDKYGFKELFYYPRGKYKQVASLKRKD